VKDGKIEPFPLREKTAAVGMLFLGDTQDCEAALSDPFFRGFMPNWHVFAAARSPRSKIDEEELFPAKLRKRHGQSIIDPGQDKVRMKFSNTRGVGWHSHKISRREKARKKRKRPP
jgi:hypothetical protein